MPLFIDGQPASLGPVGAIDLVHLVRSVRLVGLALARLLATTYWPLGSLGRPAFAKRAAESIIN